MLTASVDGGARTDIIASVTPKGTYPKGNRKGKAKGKRDEERDERREEVARHVYTMISYNAAIRGLNSKLSLYFRYEP